MTTIKEDHVSDCNEGSSGYDLLFAVFNLTTTSLSKGYAMVAHAYRYRHLHSTDLNAWNTELHDALDEYKKTVLLIAKVARASAERESKAIRRCDPKPNEFVEGVNYQSYQFLTTFVTNDYMLNNRKYIIDGLKSSERTASFCDGVIYNKTYEAYSLGACVAPLNSKRRYNYVSVLGGDGYYYNKGRVTEDCDEDYGIYHAKTHVHFYFSRYICEEPASGKKAAYFNITAQYSDLYNKRVITGIRLVTKLSITYFEIQEGVLVNGTIDNNTINWNNEVTKRLDDYEKNNQLPSYTDGDLMRLTYDLRLLDLDDIVLPAGVVAVGVQFRVVKDHLTFQVAGIRIFNELGQPVNSSKVEWFNETDPNRKELLINDLDIPTFGKKANLELSKPGENYIKFQMSSWNIDGGQTLYPFIDLQEVTTYPPAPIGGVGLFYKGQPGFGGFIAPKLITTNNTIFMSEKYLCNIFNISTSNLLIEDLANLSNDKYVPYEIILSFLCIILLFYLLYKNNFLNIKFFSYTYL
ncbi:uncharacterized protein LOC103570971 isoform X2 [Microplitis demolitor]|uniref:uncharacterized protein LOC103570971 isoform X2 n=1 Tax=Microplitis demolitor TaxID=69319 RepID=UPI0004CDBA4C|nr:uncharacterized protein LOC103570971 isoform X2 [Microplitis demolitor]